MCFGKKSNSIVPRLLQELKMYKVVLFDKEYQALARMRAKKKILKTASEVLQIGTRRRPFKVLFIFISVFVAIAIIKRSKRKLSYYEQLWKTIKGKEGYFFLEFATTSNIQNLKEELYIRLE